MMRIVVLRPLGLGDFLTAVPAYRAIARAFPEAHRILAAPAELCALVPLVGDVFAECVATAPLQPLAPEACGADVGIDLHGRGPASQRVLLASGARRLISFHNSAVTETAGSATWFAGEHEVARWCRMLTHAGIPCDPRDLALARPYVTPRVASTIVHPGAASAARRWPVERWSRVARALDAAGCNVTITGSAAERPLAEAVADGAGIARANVVAGTTDLTQLAASVACARLVISGDTGIAHLATAYETPSVVLFGPVPPAEWGPPPSARHRALWRGRRGDPHGARLDPGLAALSVEDVLAAARELLAGART